MKKLKFLVLGILLIVSQLSMADEGMWFLAFINKNYSQMKALGFKLTPEDIYSINHSSLKDAVVALDHGSCTGEIVSPNGLLFTNHHCGYGEIQAHSTVEHNYLRDGFWASSYEEELPNPGKTVSFLVRMEDVTSKVLKGVDDKMSEKMRDQIIKNNIGNIEKKASEDGKYDAEVKSMYDNNAYYLFIYKVYKDIRLVGAPPSSIGKYGGDTDNWMWPRHTGDFSIFRVYAAPDGSPAEYSPDNVPLKVDKYLKISLKGIKDKDFAMIMGYPGSTNRYLTTWEVKEVMNHENKIRIEVRGKKLAILKSYMDKDPATKIKYAAKYAQSANYYKYSIGQNLGLKRLHVLRRKAQIQRDLMTWINANEDRKQKYGEVLRDIKNAVKNRAKADIALNYWFEAVYLGPELIRFALKNYQLMRALENDEQTSIDEAVAKAKEAADEFFKDYDPTIDKDLFVNLVGLYFKKIDKKYYPKDLYEQIKKDYHGKIEEYASAIYSSSILTDKKRYMDMLSNPNYNVLAEDLGINFANEMISNYRQIVKAKDELGGHFERARRLYMEAYLAMVKEKDPNALVYPDANSTMRLTYGTVGGYTYENNTYKYYSTIDEYIAKEDPNNEEFYVTDRMKELYKAKDYGRYKDKTTGTLIIDFLTNNDITGGNSGSPVLNANGELIGLAFDGNWEGMSGDIAYEPNYQKTICVDIRFVLWVIDKYAGAERLIKELDIVQ